VSTLQLKLSNWVAPVHPYSCSCLKPQPENCRHEGEVPHETFPSLKHAPLPRETALPSSGRLRIRHRAPLSFTAQPH